MARSLTPVEAATYAYHTLKAILNGEYKELKEFASQQFCALNERQTKRLATRNQPDSRYAYRNARSTSAQNKNRYCDIVPFDYNRVLIHNDQYINASYITSPYKIPRSYIATQGPLQSTVPDFWTMVLEQQSKVIVCLSPEHEGGMEKCARYWPLSPEHQRRLRPDTAFRSRRTYEDDPKDGTLIMGSMRVRQLEEEMDEDADCIVRRIEVVQGDKSHTCTQLQFLGWADYGTPQNTHHVLALIRLANRLNPPSAGPMVVHCSAGCGRTGTFCVIDSGAALLQMADQSSDIHMENALDIVYELVDHFRTQRTTMVQAPGQYLFCYRALQDIVNGQER